MFASVEDSANDLVTVLRGEGGINGDGHPPRPQPPDDDPPALSTVAAAPSTQLLSSWNDRVEASFGGIVASLALAADAAPSTPPPPSDDGGVEDGDESRSKSIRAEDYSAMGAAAAMLRGRLLLLLHSRLLLAHSRCGGDRCDVDASSENSAEESKSGLFFFGACSSSTDGGESDHVASSIATAIDELSDDLLATDNVSCTDAPQDDGMPAKDTDGVSCIIEILRASKNLVRLHNFHVDATGGMDRAGDEDENNNPIGPLQSRGMLEVYLALLSRARGLNDDEEARNGRPDVGIGTFGSQKRMADEVARYASVVLLHIMRGSDSALSIVVRDLDGIEIFTRELIRPTPVPNLLSVVRIVHYLIGTCPDALRRIDVALREAPQSSRDLAAVLVATLAWAVRSEPTFPGAGADRRSELVEEILRVLFAVNVMRSKALEAESEGSSFRGEEEDTLTQLGIILCDIVHLPNADTRAYGCKLAAVDLLMDSPPNYANYLLLNGGIQPLLVVLTLQVNAVVVERRGGGRRDTVLLMPILAVLDKMAKASEAVRKMVKEEVFPNDVEAGTNRSEAEKVDDSDGAESSSPNNKMGPKDAPRGTLRWKLIQLMTWTTDSRIKRCASELLWTLCGGDASEFVARTGFGNAVHMLGIKGVVPLPDRATA